CAPGLMVTKEEENDKAVKRSRMTAIVKELIIYPIKSCSGIRVDEAITTEYGLALPSNVLLSDRRWMIIKNGKHQTQTQISKMATIQPEFVPDGLLLKAPNMPNLAISVNPPPTEIIEFKCYDVSINGRKYGENVSQWLSTYLGKQNLHLVYFDNQFQCRLSKDMEPEIPTEARETDLLAYQDISPLLLCSIESVQDLNKRLEKPVKVDNFRPNIVVQNVSNPYAEASLLHSSIGIYVLHASLLSGLLASDDKGAVNLLDCQNFEHHCL
ncbi:unnamed protein product, partial [Didymodactylos carnosus]